MNKWQEQALVGMAVSLAMGSTALAQSAHDGHGHAKKGLYGHLELRSQFDNVFSATDPDAELTEAYSHSHLEVGYGFGRGFSVNATVLLEGEPAGHEHGHGGEHEGHDEHEEEDHDGHDLHDDHDEEEHGNEESGDRFFEDHPLLVRRLTLDYDQDHFGGYGGKFDPVIGFDEHVMPGIYGYQVIDEYQVREKIGFGGYVAYDGGDYGVHRLDLSTFFADTTFLSDSALYRRGQLDKSDGGVSNTEDFSSFALSLGGRDFYSLTSNLPEGLSYRIGYAHQAAGENNDDDEDRISVSGQYRHVFTKLFSGRILAEWVGISSLDGEAAHDRDYLTFGGELRYGQWDFGATYTDIRNDNAEDPDEAIDGKFYQISARYNFLTGISVGIGYAYRDEEDEDNERIGMQIAYSYEF